jgi:dihydroflavonol-4-reductase
VRALVTGANGLIGANLVRALLTGGHEVRAFVRTAADLSSIEGLPMELKAGDVLDAEALRSAARDCETVFHTAIPFAYAGQVDDDLETLAVKGTSNALHAAKEMGARRVVVTSSSIVFGYATSPQVIDESAGLASPDGQPAYVAAKLRQDRFTLRLAKELGIEVVLVCPTMSVGPFAPRLGPSNAIVVQYLADPFRMTYPGGCNLVSVEDVASGHLLAAEFGRSGEHYLLGSENLTWVEIHGIVAELAGVAAPRVEINQTLSYLAASAEEVLARMQRRRPLTTRDQATMVGRFYWYSHSRAADLGYRPRPARTALARAIAWLASSPHITREVRATMHLHEDVYAARRDTEARERTLRGTHEVV